jgi:hypothetical protein
MSLILGASQLDITNLINVPYSIFSYNIDMLITIYVGY